MFQPIETAPLNGDPVFALLPNRTAVEAYGSRIPFDTGAIITWHYTDKEGYRVRIYPTHWMPMDMLPTIED
tara:strand:- start:21904 stop:22116 length:213 start_codon:yes stop_codon:yes gene_type:complete